jgi:hypothetical protein
MRTALPKFAPPQFRGVFLLLAAAGLLLTAGGCADGFIPEARSLNPYVRKQWDEDEKRGPTYYKRMEELRQVRAQAERLPEAEKQRLTSEIVDVLGIEKSPVMRAELVKTLAVLPGPATLVALEASSTDNDAEVRAAACQALGGQQGPEAVRLLAQLSGDESLDVRIEAARALGRHQTPEAAQALALSLEENDPAIQRIAMESLKSTTGKDFGMSVKSWREHLEGGNPMPPEPPSWAERLRQPWF